MRVKIQNMTHADKAEGITLSVSLDSNDLELLNTQAEQAFEIERALPPEIRPCSFHEDELLYSNDFIRTRAINDALEYSGIVPLVKPDVQADASASDAYACTISVQPRPVIGLKLADYSNIKIKRIPKPGIGKEEARESDYLDDEKSLRVMLTKQLDSDFSESEMRALSSEYQRAFERKLAERGLDPEAFCASCGLNEEQYAIMMARRALNNARWNCVLDAVSAEKNLTPTEEDVRAVFEDRHPGHADSLITLHELRNDLHLAAEEARRSKALGWLHENALAKQMA